MNIEFENNGNGFTLPQSKCVDRDNFIIEECVQKNVVHLGCVDYPLLKKRIDDGELLHLKILKVARKVWGVDLNEEGVNILTEQYNIPNLIVANAELLLEKKALLEGVEVVVAGEILEHVNNVGMVVNSIYEILPKGGMLLLTVPNALALRILFHNLRRRENVHPDHVYYFSPHTMTALLQRYQFNVEKIYGYWYPSTRPIVNRIKSLIYSIISKPYPFIGDGIIVIARKEG